MTEATPLRPCPLCGAPDPHRTVTRASLPVFQNVVYPTREAAVAAPDAMFELGTCRQCGFSYNAAFEADRVTYDVDYDNHVASEAFRAYYRDVAHMLIDRLGIDGGTVYDIGCGKGEFLRIFCELAPGVRGIGIDPSCTPCFEGNFELRRGRFESSAVEADARLIILRHVLEHIDEPARFLASLRAAMPAAPLYVEVPDLRWIVQKRAFWDFCYEHCNYFDPASLAFALRSASFEVIAQASAFGEQYQWALGMPSREVGRDVPKPREAIAAVDRFLAGESAEIARLRSLADRDGGVALWGMATKGVLLAILLGPDRVLGGIDMNVAKQGRFAAGSGVAIHGVEWLATLPTATRVLVMNPNYVDEIKATAAGIRTDLRIESV